MGCIHLFTIIVEVQEFYFIGLIKQIFLGNYKLDKDLFTNIWNRLYLNMYQIQLLLSFVTTELRKIDQYKIISYRDEVLPEYFCNNKLFISKSKH